MTELKRNGKVFIYSSSEKYHVFKVRKNLTHKDVYEEGSAQIAVFTNILKKWKKTCSKIPTRKKSTLMQQSRDYIRSIKNGKQIHREQVIGQIERVAGVWRRLKDLFPSSKKKAIELALNKLEETVKKVPCPTVEELRAIVVEQSKAFHEKAEFGPRA